MGCTHSAVRQGPVFLFWSDVSLKRYSHLSIYLLLVPPPLAASRGSHPAAATFNTSPPPPPIPSLLSACGGAVHRRTSCPSFLRGGDAGRGKRHGGCPPSAAMAVQVVQEKQESTAESSFHLLGKKQRAVNHTSPAPLLDAGSSTPPSSRRVLGAARPLGLERGNPAAK